MRRRLLQSTPTISTHLGTKCALPRGFLLYSMNESTLLTKAVSALVFRRFTMAAGGGDVLLASYIDAAEERRGNDRTTPAATAAKQRINNSLLTIYKWGGEYDDLPRVGDAPVALYQLARLDVRREELLVLARDLRHRRVEVGRADVDLPGLVDLCGNQISSALCTDATCFPSACARWRSNSTPSRRRCLRGRVGSMAWRFIT